jgi:hypothetical protein
MFARIARNNAYLIFIPFLLLYTLLVLRLHNDAMEGDEERYYQFGQNLLHGFYSPPSPNLNLWNGPGYPILLVPFIFLKTPLIAITLFNAVLQYLSVVFLFKTAKKFVSLNLALVISCVWGFYFLAFPEIPLMLSEPLTSFLIILLLYLITKNQEAGAGRYLIFAGLVAGYLTLTKIIFGYVFILLLLFFAVLFLVKRTKTVKSGLVIAAIALMVNLPYLVYTHNLTGKILYWGNSGGASLYWMSTPFEFEYGDWNNAAFNVNCLGNGLPCNAELLRKNHQTDMVEIMKFNGVEQDDAFKAKAIQNIRQHPIKYLKNCMANFSRMLFGFPDSYFYQSPKTLVRIIPNSFLVFMVLLSSVLTFFNWRKVPSAIKIILLLVFAYLGFSLLVSAYPRQFTVIVPVLLVWCAFTLERCVRIKLSFDN